MPLSTRFILCTRNKSERKSHNQIATLRACFGCLKMLRIAVGRHSDDNLRLNQKLTIILPSCFHLALIKYEKRNIALRLHNQQILTTLSIQIFVWLVHAHTSPDSLIDSKPVYLFLRAHTDTTANRKRANQSHPLLIAE